MNEQNPAIPPQPRAGAGCLGVGCMTFVGFILFLVVVVIAGGAWGLHHIRQNYSSSTPLPIPEMQSEAETTTETQPPPPTSSVNIPTTTPPPTATPISVRRSDASMDWKTFQKAAKRGERAHIELTANEINTLLANDKNTRGKAFVRIENNVGYVTVSIPLGDLPLMNGRYLNGSATVEASPDGNPDNVKISNVQITNQPVPDDFLDRRIFGWHTFRGYITRWLDDQNVRSFRIENNRVIADAGG